MTVEIRETPFNPWEVLADYQAAGPIEQGTFGATASFVGTMRDFNEGDDVCGMTLEHYPGMTDRQLEQIRADAVKRWSLLDALIVHRVGSLAPGDPIVLVATWSAHRRAAFESCRHLMEALKSQAPFWKKEHIGELSRWVEKNTAG